MHIFASVLCTIAINAGAKVVDVERPCTHARCSHISIELCLQIRKYPRLGINLVGDLHTAIQVVSIVRLVQHIDIVDLITANAYLESRAVQCWKQLQT